MEFSSYKHVLLELSGSVLRVTLNRPERRNALSVELLDELERAIGAAGRNRGISAVLLSGAGPSFCAGYDLYPAEAGAPTASAIERLQGVRNDTRVLDALWRCPVPTIAQVHGHCLAGGSDLALCCDLIICATDARFGYPAVRSMGTPAAHMWLYHLGPQWTKRLLFTGDSLTGATAADLGLALEAVPEEHLAAHARALADRIAAVPRDLLIASKTVVNQGVDLMGREALQAVAASQSVLGRHSPASEAFMDTVAARGIKVALQERDAPFADRDPIAHVP